MNKRKNLYINSSNRLYGSPSDFSIKVNYGICFNNCKLQTFNMLNTFYNITSSNNSFYINGSFRGVQPGNYTLSELILALNETLSIDDLNNIYFDPINYKLFIIFNVAQRLSFGSNSIHDVLGFESTYDNTSSSHVSANPPNLSSDIFIELSEVSSNQMSTSNYSSYNFVVINNANKGGEIVHNIKTNYSLASCPQPENKLIYNINIKIKNNRGEILQGSSNWTMLLEL